MIRLGKNFSKLIYVLITHKFENTYYVTIRLSHLNVDRSHDSLAPMDSASTTLEPLFAFLATSLSTLESGFNKLPGSAVIQRYVKSSHQDDPGRTILELLLLIFAIRTLLQSRTRADRTGKHFIQFNDKVHSVWPLRPCPLTNTNVFRKLKNWLMNGFRNLSDNHLMQKNRQSSTLFRLRSVLTVPSRS